MRNQQRTFTIALLCGLGLCLVGFGGFALRLAPQATATVGEPAGDEDDSENAFPLPELSDTEV
jgi:hypothetical protein